MRASHRRQDEQRGRPPERPAPEHGSHLSAPSAAREARRDDLRISRVDLNGAQLKLGRERPYYEGRQMTFFAEGGWGFFVVDVKSPRIDGAKSDWD
jgi:hypothetical protein